MIDELIKFAKQHHSGYANVPDDFLRRMFELYKQTTLVYQENEKIKGFAIYQEWPDCLNFIAIVGIDNREQNLRAMLSGRKQLPKKTICYFDEEKQELKIICQPQQQDG